MALQIGITPEVIGTASGKTINKLVKEKGIALPGWSDMSLDQKKGALIEHFEASKAKPAKKAKKAKPTLKTESEGASPEAKDAAKKMASKKSPAKKAKKPLSFKGKATTPTPEAVTVETGELVPMSEAESFIVGTDGLVDKMTAENSGALVTSLMENIDKSMFVLGGVLTKIATEGWISGHKDFKTYVQNAHGIKYRKAAYLMQIYKTLTDLEIPSEAVKNIGWSKTKEILSVLSNDEKNNAYWIGHAEKTNLTQLIHDVKGAKGKAKKAVINKKYFLLHAGEQTEAVDAAIKKALAVSDADGENEALFLICSEYLGNPNPNAGSKPTVKIGDVEAFFQKSADIGGAVAKNGFESAMNMIADTFGVTFKHLKVGKHPKDWPSQKQG